jgi:polyphenol oxidase
VAAKPPDVLSAPTWIEASLPNAKVVFTTRLGGVSDGSYAELNLGILTDDDPELVQQNRDLLAAELGREAEGFAMGLQVHGAGIQLHSRRPEVSAYVRRGAGLVESDAQVTTSPDVTPLVLVADCVPLLLATRGAAAAVHCGWRGIAGGIVAAALDALRAEADGEVAAAVGPGIRPCCYEVGGDVVDAFRARALDGAIEGDRLNLTQAIGLELQRGGVEQISAVDLCTSCNPDLFFSHRRDGGVTGRQAGLAWLTS